MHQQLIPLAPAMERCFRFCLMTAAPCWSERPDFVVAWTRPEGVLEAFRKLLDCCSVS